MIQLQFTPIALTQYYDWAGEDRKTFQQLQSVLRKACRDEYWLRTSSTQLSGTLQGYRTFRFHGDHRLVFRLENNIITVISCKLYYN